jgi:hypothetical protein
MPFDGIGFDENEGSLLHGKFSFNTIILSKVRTKSLFLFKKGKREHHNRGEQKEIPKKNEVKRFLQDAIRIKGGRRQRKG